MIRPYIAWCGVVVGLGILAGCSKPKPTAPDSTPAAAPKVISNMDIGPAKKGQPEQPAGVQNGSQRHDIDQSAQGPALPGIVELTPPCRFDRVEKAIANARGKVVLIDCWATWCPPCVESFPKLVEKHQKYAGKGLAVISVSTDTADDSEQVLTFLKKHNATFTNLHMPWDDAAEKALNEKFAFRNSIPHAVLFDRTGTRVWAGHPLQPQLARLIEKELAKDGPAS